MAVTKFSPHIAILINPLFFIIFLALTGCSAGDSEPFTRKKLESENLDTISLHADGVCTSSACEGENCTSSQCHGEGSGNTVFTLAGTVFDAQNLNNPTINSNAAIEFYSQTSGTGELIKSLGVDAFGNFYTTEPITTAANPALRYEDANGGSRVVHMPNRITPSVAGTCNSCHSIAVPLTVFDDLPTFDNPKYLRISDGIISSALADTNYHLNGDPGLDCLNSTCHGSGGSATATVFTTAGAVFETAGGLYTLANADIGLFPEECDDQRYNCQAGVLPENVVFRTKNPKLYIEIDSRGYFYTTQPIDWTLLTYPTLANYDETNLCQNIKHMVSDVQSNAGNCYFCHNDTTGSAGYITISGALTETEKCLPDIL
jgi:hypothetical protein